MIRFLHNPKFDSATLAAAVPSSIDSDWPVSFLQNPRRDLAMKTDGTGNVTILITYDEPQTCDGLGLAEFDLGAATSVIVRALDDDGVGVRSQSTHEAIGPLIGWLEGGWLTSGWLGYPDADDLSAYPRITGLYHFNADTASKWSVEFQNGTAEFYLGRMMLGKFWQPERGCNRKGKPELVSTSKTDKSKGGVAHSDKGPRFWRHKLEIPRISEAEYQTQWVKLVYAVGDDTDFFVQLSQGSTKAERLGSMYCRISSGLGVTEREHGGYSWTFTLEESV